MPRRADEFFDLELLVFERDAALLVPEDFVFEREDAPLTLADPALEEPLLVFEEVPRAFDATFSPADFDFDELPFAFDFEVEDFDFADAPFAFDALLFAFDAPLFAFDAPLFAFDALLFAFDALFAFDDADFDFVALDFVDVPFAFDEADFDFEAADFDFDPDDFERADEPRDVAATSRDASPTDGSPSEGCRAASSAEPAMSNWSSRRSPGSLHSSVIHDLLSRFCAMTFPRTCVCNARSGRVARRGNERSTQRALVDARGADAAHVFDRDELLFDLDDPDFDDIDFDFDEPDFDARDLEDPDVDRDFEPADFDFDPELFDREDAPFPFDFDFDFDFEDADFDDERVFVEPVFDVFEPEDFDFDPDLEELPFDFDELPFDLDDDAFDFDFDEPLLELLERDFDPLDFDFDRDDDDFVSPACARALLTVRAAISSARSSDRPASSSDSLTCSYCRSRLSLHASWGIGPNLPCRFTDLAMKCPFCARVTRATTRRGSDGNAAPPANGPAGLPPATTWRGYSSGGFCTLCSVAYCSVSALTASRPSP